MAYYGRKGRAGRRRKSYRRKKRRRRANKSYLVARGGIRL